ncbi:unnamed protein product [Blepharisma stoltei]|uniref:non-specific serine/threonine protein kinase n=1 Tax=Blepharisma stoltei TaxID=1481888 RepID=A0AAU9JWG0_9CILI|nr:unnamed protein product [Blepharisma stoltei]
MQSIFSEADTTLHNGKNFWIPYNQACLPIIYEGYLTEITEIGPVINYYLLNKHFLLKLNKGSIIVEGMTILKWKRVTPFKDNRENPKYGFKLGHNDNYRIFYVNSEEELNIWINKLSFVGIIDNIEKDYSMAREIGKGSFARVFLGIENTSSQEFAIKCFNKMDLWNRKNGIKHLLNEIDIMRKLDHPNILKLFKVYEDCDKVYLVLEYAEGGDLRKRLSECKKYPEEAAIRFIQKLLRVVDYMKSLNIVHKDIKPENILLTSPSDNSNFKLADFGLACECDGYLEGKCGSLGYVAPEILWGMKYSFNVDVFSTGVVFFALIAGRSPFYGKSVNEIYLKNLNCNIQFNEKCWINIKIPTINMIQILTNKDPSFRPLAKHALRNALFDDADNNYQINLSPLSYLLTKQSNEKSWLENKEDVNCLI